MADDPIVAAVPAVAPTPVAADPAPVVTAPATESPAARPSLASETPTLLQIFDKEQADLEAAKVTPATSTPATPTPGAPGATGGVTSGATAAVSAEPSPSLSATGATAAVSATGATAAAIVSATGATAATGTTGATAAAPEPAPLAAVEYKYTLPETLQMDDTLRTHVHKALDDFRANPADGVQGLIDLHAQSMTDLAQHLVNEQQRVFADTRAEWARKVASDPELGGSGYRTTMGAIARMRDRFVPEKDRAEFENFLVTTGAGDHPAFLRLLHNAAITHDEPQHQDQPANVRPAPGNGQRPIRRFRDVYDRSGERRST